MSNNINTSMWDSIRTLMTKSFWGNNSSKNSLILNLRSEIQELINACKEDNFEGIQEEASDVLMIMMCMMYMYDYKNTFDPDDLSIRLTEKLNWRYKSLYLEEAFQSDTEEFQQWEDAKIIEKKMQLMFCENSECEGYRKAGLENIEFRDNRFYCKLCGGEIVPSNTSMILYRYRKSNKYFKDICEAANRFKEGNQQAVSLLRVDHPDSFRAFAYYLDSAKKDDMISLSVLLELLKRKYRISEEDIYEFSNRVREQSKEMNKQLNIVEDYYTSIKNGNYHVKSQYSDSEWRDIKNRISRLQFDVVKKVDKINQFHARSWDNQIVHKYLLDLSKKEKNKLIIECMSIIHYKKQKSVDLTIELSNMYNCVLGCKFCASGGLPGTVKCLEPLDYIKQLNTCIAMTGVSPEDYENFYVSFAGIGEPSFVYENITVAMFMIRDLYPSVRFNIATFGYKKECLKFWDQMDLPIRTIQIPLYHIDNNILANIVAALPKNYDALEIVEEAIRYKKSHPECRIKLNFIPFREINDSDDDVHNFIKAFEPYKEEIVVKISYLNFTKPAEENGFITSGTSRLLEIQKMFQDNGYEAYIFGTENNTEVGCGQLSQNHISDNSSC